MARCAHRQREPSRAHEDPTIDRPGGSWRESLDTRRLGSAGQTSAPDRGVVGTTLATARPARFRADNFGRDSLCLSVSRHRHALKKLPKFCTSTSRQPQDERIHPMPDDRVTDLPRNGASTPPVPHRASDQVGVLVHDGVYTMAANRAHRVGLHEDAVRPGGPGGGEGRAGRASLGDVIVRFRGLSFATNPRPMDA